MTELGQADRAIDLFRIINPIYHADTAEKVDIYKVEPYVIAADVYSVPPHTGRGGWTWYTGSAAWMYRLGIEAILGIRREGGELTIRPSIPKDWSSYEVTYRFGAAIYHIRVENNHHENQQETTLTLDERLLPEDRIPLIDDGREHHVVLALGKVRAWQK
jgi:cellobiose phosphorylase